MNGDDDNDQLHHGEGANRSVNKAAVDEALARLAPFDDQSIDEWTYELEAAIQQFADANSRLRILERQVSGTGFRTYTRHADGIVSGGCIHDADLVCCQPFLTSEPLERLIAKIPVSSPRAVPMLLSLLIARDAGWNNAESVERSFQLLAVSRPAEIQELIAKDMATEERRESGKRGGEAKGARYAEDKKQAIAWYEEYMCDGTPQHQRISKIVSRFGRRHKKYSKQTIHNWVRGLHVTDSNPNSSTKLR